MTEKRVQFSNIVQNQLPSYVREEFPLITEFLKQYYVSQEFQGAPTDLIQNIDKYIKIQENTNLIQSVNLRSDISFDDTTINVDFVSSISGTNGFPDSYGLLKINDEIILYTGKTDGSFIGCIRGFSGISSYTKDNNPEELIFESTSAADHKKGSKVQNLNILFLNQFLLKVKHQILPGLEDRSLVEDLDQNLFLKQAKDFYLAKGTDRSFEILFKALYNENVSVIKPRDFLFTPSNAKYKITDDLVVESIFGDPTDLELSTIFQDEYAGIIEKAYAPVTSVEVIISDTGKNYYKLSLDSGYSRDIGTNGAIYGRFSVHPKTKLIGKVESGDSVLNVDSTVGFPNSGDLFVTYSDETTGVISYTSKSLNQFYGCSNITGTIEDSSDIAINTVVYGYSSKNKDEIIEVRVNSVLSNLEYGNNNNLAADDTIIIKSLGSNKKDFKTKNWLYNSSPIYSVKDIKLLDDSNNSYQLTLEEDSNYLNIGDQVSIIQSNGVEKLSSIISIRTSNSIVISGQGKLDLSLKYKIKKLLKFANFSNSTFTDSSAYTTNVQNVYLDKGKLLVASSSIPSYSTELDVSDYSVIFSGTFVGNEFTIARVEHGFYTGDAVYYSPGTKIETYVDFKGNSKTREVADTALFDSGLYFVKRINATTIKLAKSPSDIYNERFLSLSESVTVTSSKLQPYKLNSKIVQSQKIFREIAEPSNDGRVIPTDPGSKTGILVNGVEISNYKSNNIVHYGEIQTIEVDSNGSNYDVINPPELIISDSVGTGATGYVSVSGSLDRIEILDQGYDFIKPPIITITGGNGQGAIASPNMKMIDNYAPFFADAKSNSVSVGATLSTIGFSTYHRFRNAEQVVYVAKGQVEIDGIVDNSNYYVSVQDDFTVKLHKTRDDAISGINTITLSSFGIGKQFLKSFNKKSVVESITIVDPGSNYENKKRTATTSGISTSQNKITINNHGYESGEIVNYTCDGSVVSGLTANTEYYVIKLDKDNFRLSSIGTGSDQKDFFYRTGQYINFTAKGSGTHIFNYPEISVSISGEVGISSIGTETFQARIQPKFRGQIQSVHLSNKGTGYGSNIINFKRDPNVSVATGEDAQLQPVINNGQIVDVLVLNSGRNYTSPPDLVILNGENSSGQGAVIVPVMENNSISSVKIVEGGSGYVRGSVSIRVDVPGIGVKFRPILQKWRINEFQKNISRFTKDDGFIKESGNSDYGLQYSHLYAPRKLREIVHPVDQSGITLYGKTDLRKVNGIEESSIDHSPIIGWAYDGNPIYGPFGYSTNQGGAVAQMKSGYIEESVEKANRPSINDFPPGFFVEDFTFYKSSNQTVLDENNGRFCITPEFPNGTYAYFATISDSSADSSGIFLGYKRPVFPYLIGKNYYSIPNKFNLDNKSNQDEIRLDKTSWIRNTNPLNLSNEYPYIDIPNKLSQTSTIKSVSPGGIESIGIITGGSSYQVGDSIVFDNTNTQGSGASAVVEKVLGKSVSNISVATSSITNAAIFPSLTRGLYVVESNNPHNFSNEDIISLSGISTTSSKIQGFYTIGVSTNTFALSGVGTTSIGVGTAGATGIVTYFSVSGEAAFSNLKENDILGIGTEKVKILNIDKKSSRIRVLREIDGTVGSSHSVTTILYENPRRFAINAGVTTSYNPKRNKEIYFNPVEAVGLGTTAGVGIGSTIYFSNPGVGITQIFIPTKSIYLPDHGLETGDELTYNSNNGSGIVYEDTTNVGVGSTFVDNQTLFVAKITNDLIGISTVRVGLGTTGTFIGISSEYRSSTTVFFTGVGTNTYHSFKTNYDSLTGEVLRNKVTVSTSSTHGLLSSDIVDISVNPSITTSYTVKYNDYNRRTIINPKSFDSVDVNTSTNTITINDHGFVTGQKIIHTSSSPSGGLDDNGIYFIVKISNNSFKLATSLYESTSLKPSVVSITSASSGIINPINPQIKVYKNSIINFDLTDSSLSYLNQSTRYSAFTLNFYIDKDFTKSWDTSLSSNIFNVKRIGSVGISTDASVSLTINDTVPDVLYYKLDPVFDSDTPLDKTEIITDNQTISNNEIQVFESLYNGSYSINVDSPTSFTYNLSDYPERSSYNSTTSNIEYETNSSTAFGAISKILIKDKGRNYYSVPGISSIRSNSGKNAIIESVSTSIGNIKTTVINDIGFNYPSDTTLRPTAALPQILKVEPLASISFVGVSSFGRGYISAPNLLVFDGKTNKLAKEIDLRYTLGSNKVDILKNITGLSNVTPKIIPIHNSNGVGIATISFNSSTQNVTVGLSTGFNDAGTFPFEVGDKVLIENISVGVGSTAKGYNSKNYNYSLFTLTEVDENIGGIGTVTYNMSDYLNGSEVPGTFDPLNSSGRIIPEKYFPLFNINLKLNDYKHKETVKSDSATGIVESWDSKTGILRVSSRDSFIKDEVVKGLSSNNQTIPHSVEIFDSEFILNSFSKSQKGWQSDSGVLNNDIQRIQDSYYYQNFSYSLKSKVPYDTWDDVVSSLNHPVGFKKFSDYQLETDGIINASVGLTTNLTPYEVVSDLIGFGDLNCVYNFDLVRENYINIDSEVVASDEIIFENQILTDYYESIGNRVLLIDDVSGQFNSSPRSTKYSVVNTFNILENRSQKYITLVADKRFSAQRQLLIVDLLHDNSNAYINQYGRIESVYDQGSFDFSISGTTGQLLFYPTKYSVNDYEITTLAYNLKDSLLGIGSTNIGSSVEISTGSVEINSGITTTIVGIATTFRSAKILIGITPDIDQNEYELTELNLIHDGTNVELLEYGNINTDLSEIVGTSGVGTYSPYIDAGLVKIDFVPGPGVGQTGVINSIEVLLYDEATSGVGTFDMKHALIESRTTSITSSGSPTENVIGSYQSGLEYSAAYFIVQVADTTNNNYQLSEVVVLDDYIISEGTGESYSTEYANLETSSGLGTIGTRVSAAGTVDLLFTPLPSIDVEVNVYMNTLRHQDDAKEIIDFNNGTITTGSAEYYGTDRDLKRSFDITHEGDSIFQRYFDGSSSDIVNIVSDTIKIPNHFFVTGEQLRYAHAGTASSAIGIATTSFVGVADTTFLPEEYLYAIKVDSNNIGIATSPEDALRSIPKFVNIETVGITTNHRFISAKQNEKVIISIDNVIQSPVVSTALTTGLSDQVFTTDDIVYFSGITSFFGGDLIKINDEIMKIEAIGIGSTNAIRVRRNWLGTTLSGHSTGDTITKVVGNYNIVDNTLNFVEAPYGNTPIGSTTNPPSDRDWIGITTGSSFHGRVFLRSGIENTSNESYYKNYIFDDVSSSFNGIENEFTLKSNGINIDGIEDENAIILVDQIFQGPGLTQDYTLVENAGITSISFTGVTTSSISDPKIANIPVGGVIVSVGSTEGFGYQPLISAGGTSVISGLGTVSEISVGYTGSGYRASNQYEILTTVSSAVGIGSTEIFIDNDNSVFGIINLLNTGSNCSIGVGTYIGIGSVITSVGSTFVTVGSGATSEYEIPSGTSVKIKIDNPQIGYVNVSVATSDVGVTTSVYHVGFATILTGTGNISTSVSITNPGSAYTTSNPPIVVIDDPLSYSNISLEYSSDSTSGEGQGAIIDVIVGQGSSVIKFELTKTGYGYGNGEILTLPIGGLTGIPTTSSFKEFQVTIDNVASSSFTGWSIGTLQVLDSIEQFIDGSRKSFNLTVSGQIISIVAAKGSPIKVEDTLLVFVNDILQVPGEGYTFPGGSVITFTESLKVYDDGTKDRVKIIFYKGSGDVDVAFRDIIETVHVGDTLQIGYDSSIGQPEYYQEEPRTVTNINSINVVGTNPYFGPGNTSEENLIRPVLWCRQTEDKIIDEQLITKDRSLYEPRIHPSAYIIQSVGIGSTVIYVDTLRPLFNQQNENDISLSFQNKIKFIDQNSKVGASATAVVSGLGTISSVVIGNGGVGYTTATVSFGSTIGIITTSQAYGSVTISGGSVTGIAITSPGIGYTSTNPPSVLISPPISIDEEDTVSEYFGDFGIISGISTTSVGVASTGIVFDLHIPIDSFLRDDLIVGTAVTVSGISTGDYFVVKNSNIGSGVTSLYSDGSNLGIGTQFLDNVYEVAAVSIAQTDVVGYGQTNVAKVTVSVSDWNGLTGVGYSEFFGEFSWGKIILTGRSAQNSYSAYTNSGISGISTSTIVQRSATLKFKNYIV